MHNANACARVCTDAPFLFYLPLFTMFPPHSWGLNLQLALVTICCPLCSTYCLGDRCWKSRCNAPKGDWNSPDAYRSRAPAQTAQVGGWFGTNWSTGLFPRRLTPPASGLTLTSVRFRFRGHLALILRSFFFSLCSQRADVPAGNMVISH